MAAADQSERINNLPRWLFLIEHGQLSMERLAMNTLKIMMPVLLLCASDGAIAQSWVHVTQSGKIEHEVDIASIKQINSSVRKAWTRISLKNETRKVLSLEEFDCKRDESRWTYAATENNNGLEGAPERNTYSIWKPVAPGTVAQIVLQFVCERKINR